MEILGNQSNGEKSTSTRQEEEGREGEACESGAEKRPLGRRGVGLWSLVPRTSLPSLRRIDQRDRWSLIRNRCGAK